MKIGQKVIFVNMGNSADNPRCKYDEYYSFLLGYPAVIVKHLSSTNVQVEYPIQTLRLFEPKAKYTWDNQEQTRQSWFSWRFVEAVEQLTL